jgi:hypothetical protein
VNRHESTSSGSNHLPQGAGEKLRLGIPSTESELTLCKGMLSVVMILWMTNCSGLEKSDYQKAMTGDD